MGDSCDCCGSCGSGVPNIIAGVTTFTPTIPKFYWDVNSQEQGIHQLCRAVQRIIDYMNTVVDTVNGCSEELEKLEADFKAFMEHGFDDYYREQIEQWFKDNAWSIYRLLAKQVYFGLTSDGYFCAYVPDSWAEIVFDTGAVYGRSDYGRLILRFDADADSHGVIDNGYKYQIADTSENTKLLTEIIADLELVGKTLWTHMDSPVEGGE